jgi:heat shock protein HslJ
MKKTMIKTALFFFASSVFSCAGLNKSMGNENFNNILYKNWSLTGVKKGNDTITIDRTNVPINNYTIRFETKDLFGAGALNRYRTIYIESKNHTLSIGRIWSTRMSPLYEMNDFKEYEYFKCLEKVSRWRLHKGNLELYTSTEDDTQVVLIFF